MAYNRRAMAERLPLVVDYGTFQPPPNALFLDYLTGQPAANAFYEGGRWDLPALAASAQRALTVSRPREALVAALEAQQRARGAEPAAAQAVRLRDADSTAVITGQQAGLFGGPQFVLYKALAAVEVARRLEAERRAPVVPVFWVASDDHDFAEVRSTAAIDEGGGIHTFRYAPVQEPLGQPASTIVLDATITALVEELRRALPAGLHRDEIIDRVAQCYRPGETLSGAFARLLSSFLPGLVVLDPSDPALKKLMAPVLSREILEKSPTSRLAREVGDRLHAAGYHEQVPVRPGFLNLFVVMNGERRAVAAQNGLLEVRGLGRTLPPPEAVRMLEADAAAWSPGALLRPLAQDFILPTAAYVGGPAEIAYHAQIVPSYAHFGIPRPVLLPRPSLTLIESAQSRVLEAEEIELAELQGDPERVVSRWARQAYPEVEAAFARTREAIERELGQVQSTLGAIDPTLRAAADAATGRALHQVDSLHEKAIRALKKRDQARADRLRRTRDALFPGGSLQERGLGLIGFLARHGLGLADRVRQSMDPWAKGHQILDLSA